jgi:hypothetical protein
MKSSWMIHKQRVASPSPDGRLSFTLQKQEWQLLTDEVLDLLQSIREIMPQDGEALRAGWNKWNDGVEY